MTDKAIGDWASGLKPMMDIVEINRRTFEKFTRLQSKCLSDCMKANFQQVKALTASKDAQDAIESQMKFIKEVENTLAATVEQEVEAANEARDAISEIMEVSYTHGSAFFKEVGEVIAPHSNAKH